MELVGAFQRTTVRFFCLIARTERTFPGTDAAGPPGEVCGPGVVVVEGVGDDVGLGFGVDPPGDDVGSSVGVAGFGSSPDNTRAIPPAG